MEVGMKVHAISKRDSWEVTGEIVKVVYPRQELTDEEVKKYAKIDSGHPAYISVKGKHTNIKRIIIEKGDDDYTIVPLNAKYFSFVLGESCD